MRTLLGQLLRWRVHPVWYVIALVVPFQVSGMTVAVGAPAPDWAAYTDLMSIAVTLLSTIVLVGLFEELGWRGFALPRLQRRYAALWSALILGVIWASWHLPELISDPTQQRPPLQFGLGALAQSVILAWLYNSTQASLPIVMIFHAAINTAARFMLPGFSGVDYQVAWWIMTGLYGLLAALVVLIGGSERLATSITRRESAAAA